MITEKQKVYRSTMFQIAGFAMMSLMGKIVLNYIDYEYLSLGYKFYKYFLIAFIFFIGGIIALAIGDRVLKEGKSQNE